MSVILENEQKNDVKQAIICSCLFGLVGMLGLGYMSLSIKDDATEVALVFPASFTEQQTLEAISKSQGAIVRFGATSNIIITSFEHSNHKEIINQTGAIAMINPKSSAACTTGERN